MKEGEERCNNVHVLLGRNPVGEEPADRNIVATNALNLI